MGKMVGTDIKIRTTKQRMAVSGGMEMKSGGKKSILFLCTGNSCRSQMAEAWTKALHHGSFDVFSAGIEPHQLDSRAVKVMWEAGIEMVGHYAKHVDELKEISFDFIITVCDHAKEHCPFFPGTHKILHKGFEDPPVLAKRARTEEEALEHYRRIRDEIRVFVEGLPGITKPVKAFPGP